MAVAASSESLADIQALVAEARERASPSPQQAREIALRAVRQAELRGDPATLCDARLVAGESCSTLGQYAEALEHLEGAIAAASAARDASREAEAHRLVAATHDFVGNFDLAVHSHQQALRLHEGLGDDRGRAKLMRTIGVCVSKAGGFEEAIGWYRRSLETARRAGDEESALRSMVNIAIDLKNLGRLAESLALYEEALALSRTRALDNFTAGVQANMGNTLTLLGRLEEADRCLSEALEVHRRSGAPHALQNDLVGLGRVRMRQGRIDEARSLLEEGLAVAEENRFRPDLGAAHEALAELHKMRGDAARALAHYEAFNALSREMLLDESKRRLKGVELRMRIEQSQREASRDRQKSLELEEAYDRLRASAAEKEELFAKLERQSREDALTGLPNRADFERRLAAACREPREAAAPTCLALVAIEGLERAGAGAPEAWKEVARVLRAHAQPGHSLAHLGGGDFGVLMPGTDANAAQRAAQHLCAAVLAHDWAAVHPWIEPRASAAIARVDAGGDPVRLVSEAREGVRDPRSPGRVRLTTVASDDRPREDAAADPATLIRGEQVRASYANLPLTIAASFVAAILLCLVVRDVVPMRTWAPWLVAMGTASAGFLFLCRAFQGRKPVGRAAGRWGYYATAGCFVLGGLWGLGEILLHTPDSIDYQILVAVTAAIVASGAAFASATYLPPFYAFFLPAALPSAMILVNKDDATRVVTGLLLIFYLPVVTRFAIVVNRAFIESLRLRFQNVALVGELRAEKEAAESANVAKSRFLAAASHDLRQPMHALGLFLQSLRQGRLAERERGLVENISASYNAMEGLFDALLDISRLDAGVVEPRVRTFAVKRVLERLRNDYASQAAAKGLVLSVRPCGAFVRSDPTLLEEILGNFVSNAVRYTREGRVVVGCRRARGMLRIEVWDTGPGIPQDRQEDVFRDFVQLGNPERDRRQGLGLGLSIVQRLSRLLDHPLELRSAPGRGSVFRVAVPLGAPEEAETPPEIEASATLEPFQGRLIVVVDDDAAVVAAMETLLAHWGCEVASADSGARILGKLATATRRPDLILCDYRLRGGENGAQVIADIRAEFNEDIAAALITGDTDPERLKEARESGLPLLHKPVKAPRLRALMAQLLGRSATGQPT
jgi:signal transduction histidine kinase/PleD family two-component response regulator